MRRRAEPIYVSGPSCPTPGRSFHAGVALLALTLAAMPATAQAPPAEGIYVVFDASGSMWGGLPDASRKIEVAKRVLKEFVAGDFAGRELALRVYGHRREGDCRDSELLVPFGKAEQNVERLHQAIGAIRPLGKTPIGFSLREALRDFGERRGELILITDGIETCDEDPCALAREWREHDVQIRVHVVGLGLDEPARLAMQCIAEAAGTEYHDAESAATLAHGLSQIRRRAEDVELHLTGIDPDGETVRIRGTLTGEDGEAREVASNSRYVIPPGSYRLTAGVPTRNGTIYRPVTRSFDTGTERYHRIRVQVPRPPSVRARFLDRGVEQRGSNVTAYRDGKEVFGFRPSDEVFLEEGTYEFRAQPNAENDLLVGESFAAGDRKVILFEMIHTVRVTIKMVASGSGIWFRKNYELWQDGEKRYGVHARNGARVLPGTYELRLPDRLTPWSHPGLVVSEGEDQSFEIEVPVGHVTIVYQRSDGTRDEDDRCAVGRGAEGSGVTKRSGEPIPLPAGTYNVTGWSRKGTFDRVVFEIEVGEEKEVVLRNQA